ncbi:MAG TPA: M23 family metallopeptidase [Alkalispirochaeta sp.]|nr:M23 family metallopeptidase [Alkalispirochaeta sp.]
MASRQHRSNSRPGLLRRVWRVLTQRFTIMLIPHSERSVLNFHVNAMVLIFVGVVLTAIVGSFVYLSSVHIGSTAIIADRNEELSESQANLDSVIGEVQSLLRSGRAFDEELVDTINSLGIEQPDAAVPAAVTRGDLASFFDIQAVADDQSREIQDIQNLTQTLEEAINPLREMRSVLQSQQSLLSDLPNFWPVANGMGRVTMEFGPNIHPITGQWYLHKGIDIAGPPGLPILASANGKVVEMGYDPGYGFYVFLRHKYGFRTRYSHLQSILVTEGQDLVQGERIGTLGNTGTSTGPHLDFIVMLGTDVVDPSAFLTISNSFTRGGIGTR